MAQKNLLTSRISSSWIRLPTDSESNGWWYKPRWSNQYKHKKITRSTSWHFQPASTRWVEFCFIVLNAQVNVPSSELSNHLKLLIHQRVKAIFLSSFPFLPLLPPSLSSSIHSLSIYRSLHTFQAQRWQVSSLLYIVLRPPRAETIPYLYLQ